MAHDTTAERARRELERTSGFRFQGSLVLLRRTTTLDHLADLRADGRCGARPARPGKTEAAVERAAEGAATVVGRVRPAA